MKQFNGGDINGNVVYTGSQK